MVKVYSVQNCLTFGTDDVESSIRMQCRWIINVCNLCGVIQLWLSRCQCYHFSKKYLVNFGWIAVIFGTDIKNIEREDLQHGLTQNLVNQQRMNRWCPSSALYLVLMSKR